MRRNDLIMWAILIICLIIGYANLRGSENNFPMQQAEAGACVYEVQVSNDTITVGWSRPWDSPIGPVCPDYNHLTDHDRVPHHTVFLPPCPQLWAITSHFGVERPVLEQDLTNERCDVSKRADLN